MNFASFESAMQDVYTSSTTSTHLVAKGLERLDDMLRPAIRALSDMTTASLAKHHGRSYFNGEFRVCTRTATLHREGVKKRVQENSGST